MHDEIYDIELRKDKPMDSERSTINPIEQNDLAPHEGVTLDTVTQGKPLKELIGMRNGKLDMSQFEQLMHEVISQSARKADVQPHKLVRVIRKGKVQWTTAAQAKEQIKFHREKFISDQSDEVATAIEKAMHGDVNIIEDELLILLCVAHTGFGNDPEAVKKFERRHEEIVEITTEIRDTEIELTKRKRDSGIINDFEDKMGLMMQARHSGEEAQAKRLADELRGMKSKYVLYSRSLIPVISSIHAQRTDLMRTKEKLLSNMIDQLEQHESGIEMNMEMMSQNIEKVEATFNQFSKQDHPLDEDMIHTLNDRLEKLKTVMETSAGKLGLISCEKEALQDELKTTQAVVREMDKSIEEDHSNDLIKKAQGPKIDTTKRPSEPEINKLTRMTRTTS